MKKQLFTFLLALFAFPLIGQIYDPVSWEFLWEDKGKGEYEIVLKAIVEEKSHIYAMNLPDGGPIPTSVHFEPSSDFSLIGEVYEKGEREDVFDPAFKMDISWFSNEVEFRQRIRASSPDFIVKGYVTYMACDDHRCSPPQDREFAISITASSGGVAADAAGSGKGMFGFFLFSLFMGFLGILTPCVFPMIPMTVAFFSRSSVSRSKAV